MEGTKENVIVSATCTYVNVAGKVLFLYCYGPQKDLEWTRSTTKAWATMVLDSNSQPPSHTSGGRGISKAQRPYGFPHKLSSSLLL